MIFLAVVSLNAVTQIAPSYRKPWNEVQTYAPDLVWREDAIPAAVFAGLPMDMKLRDANGEPISIPGPIAFIDLDGDGKDEIIVQSGEWFSGGPEFAILQQRGNRWRLIGEIQGGFTVSRRLKTGHVDIETWSRHPETYHRLWKFSEGRYKVVRTEIGPWKDRGHDIPYVPQRNRN